ncbi:MAG: apolipoprotein acyltransferase [Pseudooceanicola sp.]|mgnify:CR=1 FL=1|jgi:uncharacterized membrane protein YebE (DUF533 family)|nr:apolipoprotein acyltransferase [Pseudooceanicola sp.]|tara:strand:- start:1841 stop:2008 length:168 start_codon:yes stop_codon:yes gene_type:complete
MLVICGALIGAVLGAWSARRNGGKTVDMLQYAAGGAIGLALLGTIATIVIHRMML